VKPDPVEPCRRTVVTSALGALAGALGTSRSALAQKAPGETRVLFLLGDYYHNPAMQEYAWRVVLKSTGWRLMFAQAPSFITPDIMAAADLYVLCRYATSTQANNISLGWSPDKIVEKRPEPEVFMTPEHEAMLVRNVRRGMGLVAMHCAVWNPNSRQYLDLLGVVKPVMHGPVVGAHIFELNQEHPITRGMREFNIGIDEVFDAEMKPGVYTQLFRSSQEQPKRNAIGGWCREEGSGRVVTLLPGHTTGPYGSRQFLEMMWRSAHWALKRDIPPVPPGVFTATA
jgi:type 1 glutamine amidotransferase